MNSLLSNHLSPMSLACPGPHLTQTLPWVCYKNGCLAYSIGCCFLWRRDSPFPPILLMLQHRYSFTKYFYHLFLKPILSYVVRKCRHTYVMSMTYMWKSKNNSPLILLIWDRDSILIFCWIRQPESFQDLSFLYLPSLCRSSGIIDTSTMHPVFHWVL